jgi:tight adherence protein C
MPLLPILAIGILGTVLIVLGLRGKKSAPEEIGDRLSAYAMRPVGLHEQEMKEGFGVRVLQPIIKRMSQQLGQRSPSASMDRVRSKLSSAGNPNGLGPIEFLGMRYLVALGLGGLLGFLMIFSGVGATFSFLMGAVGAVFGFMMPGIWLDRKIKARRKDIMKSLPDAIDLLTISVESGLGFDPALQRVAEKWDNSLTREFARVLSEMRIGKPKREALREMSLRCDEDGLTTFVSSVIQADTLGVPITQVLRIQSEAMRVRRRQKAEEMAQKAPLKMLFPMVFLIFPALYVVILGPAIPQIMRALGS